MRTIYPVALEPDGNDFIVQCRDLPELVTAGYTEAEALENAEDALVVVLLTYMENGTPLPEPSPALPGEHLVQPPAPVAAKLAVWQAFVAAGISKSELARRMGVAANEAQRVLDPDYVSKLDKLDLAARALGMRLVVTVEAA